MMGFLKIIFAITFISFSSVQLVKQDQEFDKDKLVCRNEITGEELDWFTLYKLPKEHQIIEDDDLEVSSNPYLQSGTAYTYITNKNQDSWKFSTLSINDTNSLPGRTLESFYSTDDPSMGYVLYNDQADKVSIIKGHTKGIILFNEVSVVWIVHSIPHYPPKKSEKSYSIHSSQCIFGQSMICMSFNFDQLEIIGRQILFNYPQIYDFYVPDNLKNNRAINDLISATKGEHIKQAPWFNIAQLTTKNGEKLQSFAKFTNFEQDLYSGLVASNLQSDLYTETWNNGAGTLNSNCSSAYHVMNIETVNFDFISLKFSVHHDHSKWTVTTGRNENLESSDYSSEEVSIACIGDINRQIEQFKRSGGTICFMNNKNVWRLYSKLVLDVESCPRHNNDVDERKVDDNTDERGIDDNTDERDLHDVIVRTLKGAKKIVFENNEKIIML